MILTGSTRVDAAAPTGSGKFVDYHGSVLRAVQLYLIYWGEAWTATRVPNPAPDQITSAVRTMMAGSYLTGLAQYRGIGRGVVRGSVVITTSDPPASFTDKQVRSFLNAQFDAGRVPGPDPDNQTVYCVVMPTGARSEGSGFVGEHSYYSHRGRRIHFLWTADSSSLASATSILSHEVVESATDPQGSGFRGVAGACGQPGWCEIADVCSATAVLDGVTVASYWSNQANGCVIHGSDPLAIGDRRGIDGDFAPPAADRRPRSTRSESDRHR
jgi:hypothetical protein